jgi:hypothetical protein
MITFFNAPGGIRLVAYSQQNGSWPCANNKLTVTMSRSENSWRGVWMIRGLAGIRKLYTIVLQRLTSEHHVVISLYRTRGLD